jgi:hypothetical protein
MEIKLTNVLYNFEEFYRRCNIHLKLNNDVQEQLESLYEQYMDIVELSLDNSFEPEENVELSLEIIEFLLDNFHYFKNDVFVYSLEQTLAICPDLTVVNYNQIYNKLIETYSLNEEGDISLFNANIQEIDVDENDKDSRKVPTFDDIVNFVKNDNNSFMCETEFDEWIMEDETIDFATRENGNVGSQRFGQQDYKEAKRLKTILEQKFQVTVEIDTVDEWVNVYVKILN